MKQLVNIVLIFLTPIICLGQNTSIDDTLTPDSQPVAITAERPITQGEAWRIAMNHRANNARVTVFNKTKTDLDSVYFAHELIGSIPKDSSITFFISGKILMADGTPCGTVKAKARLDQEKSNYRYYCDSGPYTMKTGAYCFDIVKVDIEDKYFFAWRIHNEE